MYGQGEQGPEQTRMLTDQAVKMAVADAFPVESAVKGLESAMSQWNLQSEDSNVLLRNSQYIIDIWTKTAHNGAASAQDIAQAIENAGTAAAQAGISFDFFNSLVETGVRTTARSGNEIGQSIKSMMVSMQSDRSMAALEKWGIKTREIGEDGKERMRSMQDIILDTSLLISTTDKDTQKLIMTLSGGRYQYSKVSAILKNYKELLRMQGVINGDGVDGKQKTQGFTDRQVDVQLSTIKRKFAALKADTEGIFADIGKNGGVAALKWIADTLDDIVVGFRKMQSEGHGSLAELSKDALALIVGLRLIQKLALASISRAAATSATWQTSANRAGAFMRVKDYFANQKNDAVARGTARGTLGAGAANTSGIVSNTAAVNGNTGATAQNTGAVGANTAARGASTVKLAGQTLGLRNVNGVLVQNGAQLASNTARTALFGTTLARLGATAGTSSMRFRALSATARGLAVAETVATTVSRVLSATLAAFGGVPGLIATAAVMLGTELLFEADAAGEAENATKRLKESHDELIASVDEAYQLAEQQGKAAEQLATQYNQLADAIESGTLSDEEAARAKEHLGEIDKTVAEILGDDAVKFDEHGRMNIETIQNITEAHKAEAKQKLKDEMDKRDTQIQTLQQDMTATVQHNENVTSRIEALKANVEACQTTASAYDTLYNAIMQAKIGAAQASRSQWEDIKERASHFGEHSDDVMGEIQAKGRDAALMIQGLWYGGIDGLIQHANQEIEQSYLDEADAIQQGMDNQVNASNIRAAFADLTASIDGSYARAAAANGYAAKQAEIDTLKQANVQSALKLVEIDNDGMPQQQGGETEGSGDGGSTAGRSTSGDGAAADGKTQQTPFTYWNDTMKVAYNVANELKGFHLGVPELLAIIGRINGIDDLDFSGLSDPFCMGAGDDWESGWQFKQAFLQNSANKSTGEILKTLGIDVDMAVIKNDADALRKVYDFEANAPHGVFADPYNAGPAHDYANGGYTDPHLREIADKTAAIISQKAGIYANPDYLYGQMMAEGAHTSELAAKNHNYAGLGGGFDVDYGSDENYIQAYAKAYTDYAERLLAIQAPTAADFVDALENSGRSVWFTAKEKIPAYTATVDQYGNEGKQAAAADDIDATPTGILAANYDIKWRDSDALDPEFLTKLAMFHEHFLRVAKIAAGSEEDFDVTSTIHGEHDDPNHPTGKAADIVSNLFYDADFRQEMTDWAEAHGMRVYDEYVAANHTAKTTGDNYHISDAGGAAADYAATTKSGGIVAQGAGYNIVHPWEGMENTMQGFHVSGAELKQTMDKLTQALQEAAKATFEYRDKVYGSLDPQTYKDRMTAADHDAHVASENFDFWKNEEQRQGERVQARLHNGNNQQALAALHGTDFNVLSDDAQTRIAKLSNDKELQEDVKALQTARSEREKAYGSVVQTQMNALAVGGYMDKDALFDARLKSIDTKYNGKKRSGELYGDAADLAAAKEKVAIIAEYQAHLQQVLATAREENEAELHALQAKVPAQQQAVQAAQAEYDERKKIASDLASRQQKGENVGSQLSIATTQLQQAEDSLTRQKTTLDAINQGIETRTLVGNKEVQDVSQRLEEVAETAKQVDNIVNKTMVDFKQTITESIDTMFSDIILQSKSFSEAFQNVWKSIGQLALQILLSRFVNPWIGSLFGKADGGSVDKKATGGILGYATGGQAGGAIHGAGTGTSDSILAYLANKDKFVYLSNGEYVMTAEATSRIGTDTLDRMNYGKYADGGLIAPTPYVPNLSQQATRKAQSLTRTNANGKLEALMQEQTQTIRQMGKNEAGGGVVVLNTHASSDDVMKALAENPRAVQTILGRQRHFGFR